MEIIIIGGTGFIGAHVTRYLFDAGHRVMVLHRGQTDGELPPSINKIHGDRAEISGLREEFKRLAPQVVIDMIPFTEDDATTLMHTFRGVARRVVAISSMDVYRAYGRFIGIEEGPPDASPFTEDAPLRKSLYPYRSQAKSPDEMAYNYEKILVEQAVTNNAEVRGTVVRLPKVYGPGDRQNHLFDYLKRMDDGRPAILLEEGQAEWRWTRGYVENIAAAIALVATDERAEDRIYNAGEGEALTEAEWIRSIGEAAGWDGQIMAVPRALLPHSLALPYDWRHDLAADSSRIRTELGYNETVPRNEALKRTILWQRANPPDAIDTGRFDYTAEDATLARISGC